MKLSIWQQFSSNHSAAFSIVAQFKSAEMAEYVADEVTKMLVETYLLRGYDMWAWKNSPPRIKQELEYDASLGITWMLSEQHIRRALQVFANTIFVSDSPGYSNFDGSDRFFIEIFRKLGANVVAAQEDSAKWGVEMSIRATAKDEETAQKIVDSVEVRDYYPNEKRYYPDGFDFRDDCKSIHRDGNSVYFENIYFSCFDFKSFSPWYHYIKTNDFHDAVMTLQEYDVQKALVSEVTVSLDAITLQRPMWDVFGNWAATAKSPLVLAKFGSQDEAQSAVTTLKDILYEIRDWSDAHTKESKAIWAAFWEKLSPPEIAFQQKYDVEWNWSLIEWLHSSVRLCPIEDFITVLGNRIILTKGCNSWVGITALHPLLTKLGAEAVTLSPAMYGKGILFDLIAVASNEALAVEVASLMENMENDDIPPWFAYYGGKPDTDTNWYTKAQALLDSEAERKAQYQALAKWWGEIEYMDELTANANKHSLLETLNETVFDLPSDNERILKQQLDDMRLHYAKVTQDGKYILIEQIDYRYFCSLQLLPSLEAWLRNQGFETSITAYEWEYGKQQRQPINW